MLRELGLILKNIEELIFFEVSGVSFVNFDHHTKNSLKNQHGKYYCKNQLAMDAQCREL